MQVRACVHLKIACPREGGGRTLLTAHAEEDNLTLALVVRSRHRSNSGWAGAGGKKSATFASPKISRVAFALRR